MGQCWGQLRLALTFCVHPGKGELEGVVVDGGVCDWSPSPWEIGQDLGACPRMRDGWQHDCT